MTAWSPVRLVLRLSPGARPRAEGEPARAYRFADVGRAQEGQGTRARDEMNEERDTDARLWHPWLRINRAV